jgi:putative cell wall-binding protein
MNNEWSSLLSAMKTTDNKFWRTTKILKRKQNVVLTLLHNGAKIFSDQEKVDVIAKKFSESHLLTVNQTNTTDINQNVTEKIAEIQGGSAG